MEIVVDFIPKSGDIVKRVTPSGQKQKYVWIICPECSGGRWISVSMTKRPAFTGRCKECSLKASKAMNWSVLGSGF